MMKKKQIFVYLDLKGNFKVETVKENRICISKLNVTVFLWLNHEEIHEIGSQMKSQANELVKRQFIYY